ncbi:MAG: DUF1460 domain-containing protein [Nitrospirae bacterium]|nr:DUF1460 domain-containing protein [Nitrospirota bacterium]
MQTHLGKWTIDELDRLLHNSSMIADVGERIEFLSKQFLGVAYQGSTLVGDPHTPEIFVINLAGVDCFTLIDCVEAMRLSGSFSEFTENLKSVRYRGGEVSFEMRNHFFTDWPEYNAETIGDVTDVIGGSKAITVRKRLNLRRDGTPIVQGIPPKEREIHYIPVNALDDLILGRMKTGDYAGIYNPPIYNPPSPPPLLKGGKGGFLDDDGLDVTHVGIIIKTEDGIFLRHASSRMFHRKVIDEEFKGYIAEKQGLVVLRPR